MAFMLNDHGFQRPVLSPEPHYQAGNAEFFDSDPACRIQVRPLLKADYGEWGQGRNGNTILFARGGAGELDYVCFLRMPPHLRKNNRAGVTEAIRRLKRYDPVVAAKLRAIAEQSKWPRA